MAKVGIHKRPKNKPQGRTLEEYLEDFERLTPKQKDEMLKLMAQIILEKASEE